MEKSKFNSIVLNYFENLKEKYYLDSKNVWNGEDIGSSILIEDYLLPYVYKNVDNMKVMANLSNMLEDFFSLNDDFCEDVLYTSFFEKIHYDNKEKYFVNYYKEKTLRFYKNLKF